MLCNIFHILVLNYFYAMREQLSACIPVNHIHAVHRQARRENWNFWKWSYRPCRNWELNSGTPKKKKKKTAITMNC